MERGRSRCRIYLATLNRLVGAGIPEKRAALLDQLLQEMDVADLGALLPESARELDELVALSKTPIDLLGPNSETQAEVEMVFRMNADESTEVTSALSEHRRIVAGASPSESLVALARDYLVGVETVPRAD